MKLSAVTPPWLFELTRFGVVGVVGFVANAVSVGILAKAVNLYPAGFLSWVIAATVTWFLNRIWTFSGQTHGPVLRQWIHFVGANSFGLLLYYAAYATAIALIPWSATPPIFAVAGGSIAGLVANFSLSRRYVFR